MSNAARTHFEQPTPQLEELPLMPHEWMPEPSAYRPSIDRRGSALSAKDLFWMTTAITAGLVFCAYILAQVFFSAVSS